MTDPAAPDTKLYAGYADWLAWAKAQGASASGAEIDAAVIARARAKGFAHVPPLDALVAQTPRFGLIAAFHVVELWDKEALVANLKHIHALLDAGRALIARFPNGHSPFGRVYQHGDITHQAAFEIQHRATRRHDRFPGHAYEQRRTSAGTARLVDGAQAPAGGSKCG